ncbi:MAG: hypothetical protein ACREUV_10800 [Burkholderiales bacterium]
MELISQKYLELNRRLHESNPAYGTSGHKWAQQVQMLAVALGVYRILDYGCGKATLAQALPIFEFQNYDPCIARYCQRPNKSGLVVCSDTMEHVEPDSIDAVLEDIKDLTLKAAFFVIHTGAAVKTFDNGENTHLVQQPYSWWTDRLMVFFTVMSMHNLGDHVMTVCAPAGVYDVNMLVL